MFAGLLRSHRTLLKLLVAQIALVLCIALLHHYGWVRLTRTDPELINVLEVAIILALTGFAVGLLTLDLRQAGTDSAGMLLQQQFQIGEQNQSSTGVQLLRLGEIQAHHRVGVLKSVDTTPGSG